VCVCECVCVVCARVSVCVSIMLPATLPTSMKRVEYKLKEHYYFI